MPGDTWFSRSQAELGLLVGNGVEARRKHNSFVGETSRKGLSSGDSHSRGHQSPPSSALLGNSYNSALAGRRAPSAAALQSASVKAVAAKAHARRSASLPRAAAASVVGSVDPGVDPGRQWIQDIVAGSRAQVASSKAAAAAERRVSQPRPSSAASGSVHSTDHRPSASGGFGTGDKTAARELTAADRLPFQSSVSASALHQLYAPLRPFQSAAAAAQLRLAYAAEVHGGDGGGGGGGGAAMTIHSDGSEWISPCESRGGGPEVVLISSEVATGALASFSKLVGGLTGMYVVYVLAVGSFARTFTTNLVTHIPYNEFPCTARLTALCEDIYAMRHVREFVLEERLYWILIRIYRRGTFTAADSRMYPGELG